MRTCITRNTSDIQIQHAGFLHVDCVTVAVLYSIHKGRIKFECRSQIARFPNRLGIHPAESMLGPQTLSRPVWRGPMLQCLTGRWTEHNKNGPSARFKDAISAAIASWNFTWTLTFCACPPVLHACKSCQNSVPRLVASTSSFTGAYKRQKQGKNKAVSESGPNCGMPRSPALSHHSNSRLVAFHQCATIRPTWF